MPRKIEPDQRKRIKRKVKQGFSQRRVAKEEGVSEAYISRLMRKCRGLMKNNENHKKESKNFPEEIIKLQSQITKNRGQIHATLEEIRDLLSAIERYCKSSRKTPAR